MRGQRRIARAFVSWTLRHGRLLWVVALLLAVPATWRTAQLYLRLRGDLEELLPRQAPSVVAIDELRARMPGLQYLGVVVDTGSPTNAGAAESFLEDLAARIRAYPPELVRGVYLGDAEEREFIERHAPLYVSLADLRSIRARIEARRDYEVAKESGALLEETSPPPLDFADVEAKYRDGASALRAARSTPDPGGRYVRADLATAVLLVEVGGFSTSAARGRALLDRVKGDVRALDPQRYAGGMRVGYAGDVAIAVEELSALVTDLSVSSVLVIAAVVLAIVFYYRWLGSVLALVLPLLLAAVYAFALASLPPFGIRELNSNTGFLGAILVGNGINFGIVLLARYVEERRSGRGLDGASALRAARSTPDGASALCAAQSTPDGASALRAARSTPEEALAIAVSGSWVGTLAAALAAGASYASLALTQFRGFRQFGVIGGLGMLFAWGTAFVLMPPLVAALDRPGGTLARAGDHRRSWTGDLARLITRHSHLVAALGITLSVAAALEVRSFTVDRNLEYDFSRLRRADTWKVGEGYWGRRMDAVLGRYLTPTVILADDPEQARAIAARLREEIATPPLSEMIQTVRTLEDVLPGDQAPKIEEARRIREDMTPRLRALVRADERALVERLVSAEGPAPIAVADLPHRFTTAMLERDGSIGRTVLVYPYKRQALWEGPGIEAFTRAVRDAAATTGGPPARVAGSLPLSGDILGSIRRDGPRASLAAFLGVVVVVVLLFRRRATTGYVLGALLTGVLWLLAATMALGVKVNFANFIAFPITFGIGVDYAVNVVSRFAADGERDVVGAVQLTGSAVALCSLTTIIGYSSLLIAENRALMLFGVIAVLGELACLGVALTVLPAVLHLAYSSREAARVLTEKESP